MHGIDTSGLPYCFGMLRFHDVTSIFLDWFVIWVDTKLRICQQSIKKLSKDVAGKTSQDLAATNWSLQLQQSQKTPIVDVPTCMLSLNFPLRRMIDSGRWRNFGNHGRSLVDDGVFAVHLMPGPARHGCRMVSIWPCGLLCCPSV